MAVNKNIPTIRILSTFMGVINQACSYSGRPGIVNHMNLGAYEEAFQMLRRMGLIEPLGNGDYQLNYDGLTQFIQPK